MYCNDNGLESKAITRPRGGTAPNRTCVGSRTPHRSDFLARTDSLETRIGRPPTRASITTHRGLESYSSDPATAGPDPPNAQPTVGTPQRPQSARERFRPQFRRPNSCRLLISHILSGEFGRRNGRVNPCNPRIPGHNQNLYMR